MATAAFNQAIVEAKKKLREFLEASEAGRTMLDEQGGQRGEAIKMRRMNGGREDESEGDGEI